MPNCAHGHGRDIPLDFSSVLGLPMNEVTRVLSAIEEGDPNAAEQLLPLVYQELRRLAAQKLAQEKPGQTLEATALVHEAYLRLVDVEKAQHWDSRGHFFAAAAEELQRSHVQRIAAVDSGDFVVLGSSELGVLLPQIRLNGFRRSQKPENGDVSLRQTSFLTQGEAVAEQPGARSRRPGGQNSPLQKRPPIRKPLQETSGFSHLRFSFVHQQ
jgi:hypothetical protein